MIRCIVSTVAMIFSITLLASCAGNGRKPVYTVKGKVIYRGKPAQGATIVLHPTGDQEMNALKSFGTTGPDGTFQVTTYRADDGVPEGEYVVTIIWTTPPASNNPDLGEGPDRLNNRYADPKTSTWRVTVEKKPLELEAFKID